MTADVLDSIHQQLDSIARSLASLPLSARGQARYLELVARRQELLRERDAIAEVLHQDHRASGAVPGGGTF
jgi:hypothetical protein